MQCEWDAIIIGTGIGGGTLGYALAKAGKSVLFCEKGKSHLDGDLALRGDYAETFFARPEVPLPKHREILSRAGRCFDEIEDLSSERCRCFIPFIGFGTGGSSALYGMAMERFFPADFTPKRYYPEATESTLPECWPITYEELQPYYEGAERLYRVRGTADPLRGDETLGHLPPPLPCPGSQELHDFLRGKGLNPYRLPIACEYVSGCRGCQGFLCARNCRNDSVRICLEPALTQFGAHLVDECEVLKLEATRSLVTGVVCSWRGHELTLRAKIVVLAAGALATPKILLESASPAWPYGLANDSGLVGRNLMRHYIDLYAVFPKARQGLPGNLKELAFNDFYIAGGQKLGTVQSFGAMPPASVIVESMEQELREGSLIGAAWLFKLAKPMVKPVLNHLFSRSIILATIMEDLPYKDNLVMLSEQPDSHGRSRLALKYRIREYDSARIKAFREKVRATLMPYRFILIKQADNNERLAHVCGTCRFGLDRNESVLDANNRAHGLPNLYVVDSSFFPSSAGTNPALTIAANALRVSEKILSKVGL
ncbi:MAG: GMC family oxidoreductase [Proteobacteria bacterium]|nr:GMC family oxidoreductase [Pseudomonadota bacterium]